MLKRIITEERGASQIVEASFIFPLVLLTVVTLIVIGFYSLEVATLQAKADRIADVTGRTISQQGYLDYGNYSVKDIDFTGELSFSSDKIANIFSNLNPYRYWGKTGGADTGAIKSKLTNEVANSSPLTWIFQSSSLSIVSQKHGIQNEIVVTVNSDFQMPSFFEKVGLPSTVKTTVTSRCFVSDNSEFIRNTDLVFDLGTFIENKTGIFSKVSGNIKDWIGKIIGQFEYLGID